MKITVHRGSDQIGCCVTEYESNGWKLFIDYGEQLPVAPMPDKALEVEGLTCGDLSKSTLLITNYHGDHVGKIADLAPGHHVFAIIDDALVSCEVVGSLTADFLNKFGPRNEEDFQEYKSDLCDWGWDKIVVRPLVKIKTKFGEISSDPTAQRIYNFPYKTLQ